MFDFIEPLFIDHFSFSTMNFYVRIHIYSSTLPIPLTPCNFIYYRVYWVECAAHEPFLLYWMSKREKERGNKLHTSLKRFMGTADAFTQKMFFSVSWMSKKKTFWMVHCSIISEAFAGLVEFMLCFSQIRKITCCILYVIQCYL